VYHVGYGTSSSSWAVTAIDPDSYGQVFTTPANLFEGRALAAGDTGQVLLGIGVAGAGKTDIGGYRASLQTLHAGNQVNVTLTNGKPATPTVCGGVS